MRTPELNGVTVEVVTGGRASTVRSPRSNMMNIRNVRTTLSPARNPRRSLDPPPRRAGQVVAAWPREQQRGIPPPVPAGMSNERRNALTPEALAMVDAIARSGSFAAAARELGKVPSALTYSVRQLEDALDVLLFDRRSRQATLTAAGQELLDEGRRLLEQIDAVANRVKRVATGWETQLSVAVDDVISRSTVLDLCAAFYADTTTIAPSRPARSRAPGSDMAARAPPPRLRIRTEVLAGTWEAIVTGHADLAIGVT